jgi:chemotaxis protein MotB
MARSNAQAIIIRKVDDIPDHGHHGGAWKVAYADFMTAMMAFFLLMWIVSNATRDQLNGISDYFTPAKVSMTAKGGTGALGGTTLGPKGTMNASNGVSKPKGLETGKPVKPSPAPHPLPQITEKHAPAAAAPAKPAKPVPGDKAKTATVTKLVSDHALDRARFKAVQKEIVQTMKSEPDLRPLLKNVLFQQTPDGLKIDVVDQAGRAMFASGSAKVEGPTLLLMQRLARAISTLPNRISITGHTDSVPYAEGASRDNWGLSSERANATRRIFVASGVNSDRITSIAGVADTEPLKPSDPTAPSNRRITVLLAYAPGASAGANAAAVKALTQAAKSGAPGVTLKAAPEIAAPQGSSSTKASTQAAPGPKAMPASAPATPASASAPPALAPAAIPAAKAQTPLDRQYSLITPADLMKRP